MLIFVYRPGTSVCRQSSFVYFFEEVGTDGACEAPTRDEIIGHKFRHS
jgi:hypothetical protein